MATDQNVREQEAAQTPVRSLSPAWIVTSTVVGALLTAWFFFAWLALDRHLIDAAGEAVGSAFALLLLVSLIGVIRERG